MLSQNELLFKYNPFKIKHWRDDEIQEQLGILVDAYISDAETVMEMALNIENLANQMFLIGEMIARLQESSNILKADIENKTNQAIYVERSTWEREHDGKVPSIKYFEALAGQKVSEERTKFAKVDSDLKRFKTAYESIEAKMNSEKKNLMLLSLKLEVRRMILGIDPANEYSAFVVVENDLSAVVDKGKILNKELQDKISNWKAENYPIDYVAIEGIQSFGMPVGQTTFETCYFIGRLLEQFEAFDIEPTLIYRSEEKMLLCHSMKAKDSNIIQALIDLFAKDTPNKGKGTKKSLDISTDSRKTYGKQWQLLTFSIQST